MTMLMGYPVVNEDDLPEPQYNPTRWFHVLGAVLAVALFCAWAAVLMVQIATSVDKAIARMDAEFSNTEIPDVAVCGTEEGVCHPELGGRQPTTLPLP